MICVYDEVGNVIDTTSAQAISMNGELALTSVKFVFSLTAYGNDSQAAANYPLVRITNNRRGHVFYSQTHDHISRLLDLALSALLILTCPRPKSGP